MLRATHWEAASTSVSMARGHVVIGICDASVSLDVSGGAAKVSRWTLVGDNSR